MKKFLLSVLLVTAIGFANKSNAQCAGASVTVYNIVFTQNGQTYNWSFDWVFNLGNASISVVYKCGGVVVGSEACLENLNNFTGGSEAGSYDFSGCLIGAKEVEIRIYASSNCHGQYCAVAQSAPLPVTFASFDVRRGTGDNVNISWSTASEINNYGFYVERNVNGKWSPAGFVPSQAVGGNSESLLSYSFVDLNNVKGITQYRIRQVDIDGRFKYTEIRTVRGEDQVIRLTVYPNPSVDGRVNVVFDDATAVRNVSVLDMSGRVVRQVNGITNNNITIENLNPGMYTVRVVVPETGAQGVQKIIVNKR